MSAQHTGVNRMHIFWVIWCVVLTVILTVATWMEYNAIRQRINGANGLVLLVAGVVCLLSLPVGGAVVWYLAGWAQAVQVVLVTGGCAGLFFYAALHALNAYAKRRV